MTHEEQTGRYGRRFLGWDVQEEDVDRNLARLNATPLYLGYSWTGRPKLFKGPPVHSYSEAGLQRYMAEYLSPSPAPPAPPPPITGFRLIGDSCVG